MELGYIGLGKMGKNMVLHLLDQGVVVHAWNRSAEPRQEVQTRGAQVHETVKDLISSLKSPRVVWFMLPNGQPTDDMLQEALPHLETGDLVIDGGNSFYKDSLRHAEELKKYGIHFMDIGTSGGPRGAREGACLMMGGEQSDFARIEELAKLIAAPGAYQHLGPVGAGHFAKMVHNGIEYGMMQAIAEGAAVLKASSFGYDLKQVFDVYNHHSVIESRLVEWSGQALATDPELEHVSSRIAHTGEGAWTVDAASELGVGVPVITESLEVRRRSESEPESFRNKMVSAMRGQFGGHEVGK